MFQNEQDKRIGLSGGGHVILVKMMAWLRIFLVCCLAVFIEVGWGPALSRPGLLATAADLPSVNKFYLNQKDYREYIDFFKEVFEVVGKNYYHEVQNKDFMRFVYLFNTKIYGPLKRSGKSKKYIKWRSAAFLVDALKAEDDIFSRFFPPKDAERFETEALGKRIDLGIEGSVTSDGFVVRWIEPRSDAYEKGLRQGDILLVLNGQQAIGLAQEEIQKILKPLEGETVEMEFWDASDEKEKAMDVVSKEYFKQAVFKIDVDIPNVFCIQIERFNRMTAEDMQILMEEVLAKEDSRLIIDLRDNPGGPPLAAQAISAFFLTPNQEFAYFQKKNRPKALLHVPEIPEELRFDGPMAILVNEKSGSASELFSGIMQRRGRATLIGQNTAGQVFLKSMFYLSDNSMVLLVTARGHHPDGQVFSFSGVRPDIRSEKKELIRYAAEYLSSLPAHDR